jgi:hypothetical protein
MLSLLLLPFLDQTNQYSPHPSSSSSSSSSSSITIIIALSIDVLVGGEAEEHLYEVMRKMK